jgi:hypothetical protein
MQLLIHENDEILWGGIIINHVHSLCTCVFQYVVQTEIAKLETNFFRKVFYSRYDVPSKMI